MCPAHDDGTRSLGLWVGRGGQLNCKCFANRGCTFVAIAASLGTESRDWFPPREGRRSVKFQIEAAYDYTDANGNVLYQSVRTRPKSFFSRRPDGRGGWVNGIEGIPKVPYRLHELVNSPVYSPVLIAEGEKDCDSLRALGFVATTNVNGAGKWLFAHGAYLTGRSVYIFPDNDPPGYAHAASVAGVAVSWGAASVAIVRLPGVPHKGDVTDYIRLTGADRDAVDRLMSDAPQYNLQRCKLPLAGR